MFSSMITGTSRLLQRTYAPQHTSFYKGRMYTNQIKIYRKGDEEYRGEVKDGKPHGKGIHISPRCKYEGDFFDGKMTGRGKKTYLDGHVVTGLFFNGTWIKD